MLAAHMSQGLAALGPHVCPNRQQTASIQSMTRVLFSLAHGLWAIAVLAILALSAQAQSAEDTAGANNYVAAAPTDAEAAAAFQSARKAFQQGREVSFTTLPKMVPAPSLSVVVGASPTLPQNISLNNVRLVLDVEDTTLADVMTKIVEQASAYTGRWTVKWRLKPENQDLLTERVNITAEAPFGEFVALLTERIRNLTGTQIYVTVFQGSRMILVSDTFY